MKESVLINTNQTPVFNFCSTAHYCIRIKGYLDASLSERFQGMQIDNQMTEKYQQVGSLTGPVRDQAELLGVLHVIYEMHLPVLSVELLNIDGNIRH
jgi:hypothetical protein